MRCSVTELDAFRRWRVDEEAELEPLLRQLRKLEPPSEAMRAGSALHKALELAEPGAFGCLKADGYRFDFDAQVELALPDLREIKAEKVYMVGDEPIVVVGKVDTLEGLKVGDHKSTSRFDAERFMDAYQWRYYLDIFAADVFEWNVFEMAEQPEPQTYKVFGFHQLRQYRYAELQEDCLALLRDFVGFAHAHLPERFQRAAA